LLCFLSPDCIYKKSIEEILAAQKKFSPSHFTNIFNFIVEWAPIIDDVDLDHQPLEILSNNPSLAKPGIFGTTTEEGLIFVAAIFKKSPLSPISTYTLLM
ncbi:carboxylesterase family protein, partial [Salmonella sp. s54836]|uniref:carboxylesterase family protein n=1 Tax=Salmonella sp. s54836 TaxID=3159673 RepID=UPI00397F92B3